MLEMTILLWVMVGLLAAILYSMRYLVLLDRRMISLEFRMKMTIDKLERDEKKILLEEKLLEKAVLKRSQK